MIDGESWCFAFRCAQETGSTFDSQLAHLWFIFEKISKIFLTTKVTRHFHKKTVAICQKTSAKYQSKKRANPRFFLRTPHQRPLTLNRKPKITWGLQITYNDRDEHLRLTSYIIMKLSAERSHLSRVLIKNVRCTNAFGRHCSLKDCSAELHPCSTASLKRQSH